MSAPCKRGEMFYADLSPYIGSEQGGRRPVIVIQNDTGNQHSPTVIIAAVTSKTMKARLPVHVRLPSEIGLKRIRLRCWSRYAPSTNPVLKAISADWTKQR